MAKVMKADKYILDRERCTEPAAMDIAMEWALLESSKWERTCLCIRKPALRTLLGFSGFLYRLEQVAF